MATVVLASTSERAAACDSGNNQMASRRQGTHGRSSTPVNSEGTAMQPGAGEHAGEAYHGTAQAVIQYAVAKYWG